MARIAGSRAGISPTSPLQRSQPQGSSPSEVSLSANQRLLLSFSFLLKQL